ncbi:uncharacterized protein K02A2.6-like [Acyrthosiphon pisum]|uniref:RNA-directed DNA polymerase n=1 Tax=Acyrthosiphon pisum TaxID=7029 RepID=A0A8R1W470_ACYPI|nr:uncharacterized protein K02A2.6-like [Acyrthosiphon pisum]|eukprot:XP_003241242.1 PREDICTED: uncharacterized protein K02A2.6-like [Acyrthosiphon pisum]
MAPNMCVGIGTVPEYHIGDDWQSYSERLDQFFIANFVEEDRKVAVLITVIGASAYATLREICDPILSNAVKYDKLCDILSKQFAPKVAVFRERSVFYQLMQEQNESVNDWYVRVKKGAMKCKFGNTLVDVLRDKFVTGLIKGPIADRVCEEEPSKLLVDLVDIALKKEAVVVQTQSQTTINHVGRVNKKRFGKQSSSHKPSSKSKTETVKEEKGTKNGSANQGNVACFHCGKKNHNFADCRYRSYNCKNCNKIGHLAVICKSNTNVNNVEVEQPFNEFNLFNIKNGQVSNDVNCPPELINLKINNNLIQMEIDSGAAASVITEQFFYDRLSNCKLKHTYKKLNFFDGTSIQPVGQFTAKVEFNNQVVDCEFIVVKSTGNPYPLCGRNLLSKLGISWVQLNSIQDNKKARDLNELLIEYKDLFSGKLGEYAHMEVHLELNSDIQPIFHKHRCIPFAHKLAVEKELQRLEDSGVIKKSELCQWGTPLVPVLKPDGSIRLCADYKATLNRYIKDIHYPFPRIEDLFATVQGGQTFSKLDFSNAYNQLKVDSETSKLLAWSTHKGTYEVLRLPYGIKPATAIFQREVEKIFKDCAFTANLLDDIVVTGRNDEEHFKNLAEVFKRCKRAGFQFNRSKCQFFQPSIKYLGHIIDKDGLRKDPEKVNCISKIARPQNVTELKSFLGMINYYGKFVKNLAKILAPLHNLLKKSNAFVWSKICDKAFNSIKTILMSEQVLTHYNPDLPIVLTCDASNNGLGAVLSHVLSDNTEKPINFASRALSSAEKNYSTTHKEALAVVWGVTKNYQYLKGREFIIRSDHKPLMTLLGEDKVIPKMASGRVQRWAFFLSGFKYKIEFIKGTNNTAADSLSRISNSNCNFTTKDDLVDQAVDVINWVDRFVPVDYLQIRAETSRDPTIKKVINYMNTHWPKEVTEDVKPFYNRRDELVYESKILMWGYRIIIPSCLTSILLKELHGSHMGIVKMKSLARSYFWWPSLDLDIETLAKNCAVCVTFRPEPAKTMLTKWPQSTRVFERIHADYAGPINNKMYLILTDSFSKWPEIFEVSKADTHNTIEKLKETFSRYGLPDTIVTDNGTPFTSGEFSEFCELNSIKHLTSPPWHPSSNGAAENAVKSFKIGFGKILMNKSEYSTDSAINKYLFYYRNAIHSTTGCTPSKLMFGREANIRLNKIKPKPHSYTAIDRQIRNYKGSISNKVFNKNDAVFIRDYSKPNKKGWKTCIIDEIVGNNIYICKEQLTNRYFKRHADQIVKAGTFYKNAEDLISEPEQTVECNSPTQVVETDVPKEINSSDKPKLNDNSLAEEDDVVLATPIGVTMIHIQFSMR